MDLQERIISMLKSDPNTSELDFIQVIQTAPLEEAEKLKNLEGLIPFPALVSAVEKYLKSQNISFRNKPISRFVPPSEIKSLVNEQRFHSAEEKRIYEELMNDIFLHFGQVPKHKRLMGHYPYYLLKHFEVMKILFSNDLSIPCVWRHYIAYMAAATHKCEYLMKLEQSYCERFHTCWITEVPLKIQMLGTVNVKLAHRPWELAEKDIKELLKVWNLNELILALTIMCQFHCLSGFVLGLGVAAEGDFLDFKDQPVNVKPKTNVSMILRTNSESTEFEDYVSDSSEDLHGEDENLYFSKISGGYLQYINYPMDLIARTFNASDFRFSDQAIYILEKAVPEISDSIWNKIRIAFAMTYDRVGQDSGVETAPLRRAIWNYVQRVYGLQYDDFSYTDINKFLKINTKKYIKKVACMPEIVTEVDYNSIEIDLSHDDMIHLNILICEARFEAQLVYMLHAMQ